MLKTDIYFINTKQFRLYKMIILNQSNNIADKYFERLNHFGLSIIIPVTIGLFLAKGSNFSAQDIQVISQFFLVISILYLVIDSSEGTKNYKRIAKVYVEKNSHLILTIKTLVFIISYCFLGSLAVGLI